MLTTTVFASHATHCLWLTMFYVCCRKWQWLKVQIAQKVHGRTAILWCSIERVMLKVCTSHQLSFYSFMLQLMMAVNFPCAFPCFIFSWVPVAVAIFSQSSYQLLSILPLGVYRILNLTLEHICIAQLFYSVAAIMTSMDRKMCH